MNDLSPADFPQFIAEVYGYEPFPWQSNLASTVFEDGWPDRIQMPTGAGKTMAIDIAVFHLALEALDHERSAPTRIFYTIDRRVVVDQAFNRAQQLRDTLSKAQSESLEATGLEVTRNVAERLAELGDSPLVCDRLRGGLFNDDVWFADPAQPAIYATTVDQIGSRLLFRGYGVSDSMKPVHAGLAGMDALYILDEVHLSQPFQQTLDRVASLHAEETLNLPFQGVSMSATPLKPGWSSEATQEDDREHETLGPRLQSVKETTLIDTPADELVETLVSQAQSLVELDRNEPRRLIGITANTVKTAREVYTELTNRVDSGQQEADVSLLVGRARTWEKQRTTDRIEQIASNRDRRDSNHDAPHYVVATQTIEVGADFDFDGLVTELAPLDSLRQRLGRVDRFGELGTAQVRVIADDTWINSSNADEVECLECDDGSTFGILGSHLSKHDLSKEKYIDKYWEGAYGGAPEHPIYGRSLKPTWDYLTEQRTDGDPINLGATGIELPDAETTRREAMCSPNKSAPTLLTPYIDVLSQTSPRPHERYEPEIPLFLHGPDTSSEDIQVVWRADLSQSSEQSHTQPQTHTSTESLAGLDPTLESAYIDAISARPPLPMESLSIPLWAVKKWLSTLSEEGSPTISVPDTEGGASPEPADQDGDIHVLLWRGTDESEIGTPADIQPGDTVILPSTIGGHDRFAFNPASDSPVADISLQATAATGGAQTTLALTPQVINQLTEEELPQETTDVTLDPQLPDSDTSIDTVVQRLANVVDEPDGGGGSGPVENTRCADALADLADGYTARVHPLYESAPQGERYPILYNSEQDGQQQGERQATRLERHSTQVAAKASSYTDSLPLPEDIGIALERAAKYHDIGKLEHRFQLLLQGGQQATTEPLAKSSIQPRTQESRRARQLSEYPPGRRHEAISADLFDCLETPDTNNNPLIKHLIGAHHGNGRPMFPRPPNQQSQEQTPDTVQATIFGHEINQETQYDHYKLAHEWPEQYWELVNQYGPWTLAYLESFIRIADQHTSRGDP